MINLSIFHVHASLVLIFAARQQQEDGQEPIEYALLGGLIAAGIVGVLALFGGPFNAMAAGIWNCIDSPSSICTPGF